MAGGTETGKAKEHFDRKAFERHYVRLHGEIGNRKMLIHEAITTNGNSMLTHDFKVGGKIIPWRQMLNAAGLLLNPPPTRLGPCDEPLQTMKEIIWELEDFLAKIPGGKKPRCPSSIVNLLKRQ